MSTSSTEKNFADKILDYLKNREKSGDMALHEHTFKNMRLRKWSKN